MSTKGFLVLLSILTLFAGVLLVHTRAATANDSKSAKVSQGQRPDDPGPVSEPPGPPSFVFDELLIRFQPKATEEEIADFYAQHSIKQKENIGQVKRVEKTLPRHAAGRDRLLRTLNQDPRIEYAELNFIFSIAVSPDAMGFAQHRPDRRHRRR